MVSNAPVLGIDLGTTNSVVAIAEGGTSKILRTQDGRALVPSVVSFHPSGEVLVGAQAKDRRLLDAENTVYSVKRLIGRPHGSYEVQQAINRFAFELTQGPTGGVLVSARGETYTLSEISAFVLRHVRKTAEQALGVRSGQAVITVPANFNELQRSATKAAGRVAGLEVLRILNEPTAAALAYGYGKTTDERLAVYDFGGGTFDVTILQLAGDVFEVLATAGDTFLGGDDVDTAIADDMAMRFLETTRYDAREDRQAYERLRAAAEWAKCQLSKKSKVKLCMEELAYGDGGKALDLNYDLTRQKLEQMAQPLLARTFDVCEDAMRVAGVRPTQLDNVILVGGSTRIPLLQQMVTEYFGRKPLVTIDPDLVVAQGAALQAASLAQPGRKATLGKLPLKKVSRRDVAAIPAITADDLDVQVTNVGRPPISQEESQRLLDQSLAAQASREATTPDDEQDILEDMPTRVGPVEDQVDGLDDVPTEVADLDDLLPDLPSPDLDLPLPDLDLPMPGKGPPPPPPPPPAVALKKPEPAPLAEDQKLGLPSDLPRPEVQAAAPLLLDVTPLSLGVETVDGYCEHIIGRNSAIPAEETKMFTTARDDQEVVAVRICQGESRRIDENQLLGEVVLEGLRKGARGDVQIAVTFYIDPDGTLNVRAKDTGTGLQQAIAIKLIGELPEEDVEALRARHEEKFGD